MREDRYKSFLPNTKRGKRTGKGKEKGKPKFDKLKRRAAAKKKREKPTLKAKKEKKKDAKDSGEFNFVLFSPFLLYLVLVSFLLRIGILASYALSYNSHYRECTHVMEDLHKATTDTDYAMRQVKASVGEVYDNMRASLRLIGNACHQVMVFSHFFRFLFISSIRL